MLTVGLVSTKRLTDTDQPWQRCHPTLLLGPASRTSLLSWSFSLVRARGGGAQCRCACTLTEHKQTQDNCFNS